MLKLTKFILMMLLLTGLAQKSILSAEPYALSNAEAEFAGLVIDADTELDLNQRVTAEQHLLQASQLLVENPNIDYFLQGHFNKVYGKLYMKYDASIALPYFNTSISQFSGNALEQAETKMFIGITYYHAGNYAVAKTYFEEAKAAFDLHGDMQKSAQALNNLGVVYFQQGNAENAISFCGRSYSINTELGNRLNAERNQQNLVFFTGDPLAGSDIPRTEIPDGEFGGTGSGTSGTITTSGSGTVVVPPTGG